MSKPIPPINLMFDHKHDKRQQKGRVTRSTAGLLPFFLLLFVSFFISFTTKAQLTASFTADDTSGCAPVIVHFTNTSTNATSYFWDLGNGNTSTLKDAAGTYAAAGTYTVTLTAFAGSASKTYTMTVNAYAHPVVIFSSATRSVCPGIPVSFTNSSVANCWGTLSYKWSFGEGGSSTSATPAYAYTSPGSYTVTLLASNNGGCVSSTSMSNYIFVNTPAAISFGVSSGFICKAPGSVSFTNLTTGAAPINYTWRFGDGGTSGLKTPSHSYTTPNKTYDVTLIAQDGNGCVDSLQKPGFVSTGKLTANFSAPHDSCQFVPLTFYNTSTTHTTSKWTFGDGTKATGDTVKHNYLATGTYNVKLVITDGTCADSITKTVTIGRPTGSSFVVTPVGACSGIRSRTFTASMPAGTTASWISNIHGSMGTGNPLTFNYPVGGVIDGITLIVTDKFGCKDSLIDIKDTVASLVALISGKPFEGCVPLTANFTPEVFGKAYTPFGYYPPDQIVTFPYPYAVASYLWDFGDGSPKSMLATPVHTYTAEGAYDVYCEVTTVNGCKILALTPARAGATVPVASFTMDRNRTCSGQPTTFTSTSTGTITDYAWAFDTLGDSHAKDTVFKFTVPGIHEVRLEVSNNGCVSSRYKLLDTIDSPGARIVYKYTCIPVNGVAFSDTLNGDNTHLWQFGDGATSTANSPVHLFPALQTYSVTLTTYNAATGCRDTNTIDVSLERITARLTPDHSTICKDRADTITAVITHVLVNKVLSGKKSLALEKYTTRTQWYFNNVAIDTGSPKSRPEDIKSPIGDTARIFINRFGRDTAMLITTSNWGCLDTTKVEIIAAKPKANFSNTPAGGCAPLPVTFKDLSTDAPGTSLTNFTWAFGSDDPVTVTTSSIVHPYSASGTYTVTEYVTDNIGCSDTITKTNVALTINNPKAAFSVNAKTCVGLTSKFDNLSTAGTFLWKFGDGATSTASVSPVFHTYSVAGVYDVTLIITNAGCRDTMFVPGAVTVNVVPKASFTLSDSFAVCPPLSVDFNNTTTGATSYVWTFGDGSFSAATSPSDIYTAIGKYRIKLQAVNQYGCVDTAVANASIFGYAGAFTYSPLKVCTSSPVHFKALVSGVIKVKWDFSDGIIDSSLVADTISHSYLTAKSYVPKLILTDGAGCTSIS
ncbi:MAG: hypothetical protein JWQ38_2266, partial [Flavipsychrobacter sp.]|nr:hypothetical protein [Flavipsychrobacter sp.]